MKKYIKPSIKMIEVKSRALLSGSWEEIPINDGSDHQQNSKQLYDYFDTDDAW